MLFDFVVIKKIVWQNVGRHFTAITKREPTSTQLRAMVNEIKMLQNHFSNALYPNGELATCSFPWVDDEVGLPSCFGPIECSKTQLEYMMHSQKQTTVASSPSRPLAVVPVPITDEKSFKASGPTSAVTAGLTSNGLTSKDEQIAVVWKQLPDPLKRAFFRSAKLKTTEMNERPKDMFPNDCCQQLPDDLTFGRQLNQLRPFWQWNMFHPAKRNKFLLWNSQFWALVIKAKAIYEPLKSHEFQLLKAYDNKELNSQLKAAVKDLMTQTNPNLVSTFFLCATERFFSNQKFVFVGWLREICAQDTLSICRYQESPAPQVRQPPTQTKSPIGTVFGCLFWVL